MNSIKDRAVEAEQPEGGYLKVTDFDRFDLADGKGAVSVSDVPAAYVARAVDGLSRMALEGERADVFYKYMRGASRAEDCGRAGSIRAAKGLKDGIAGMDDESIRNACRIASFGDWLVDPAAAEDGPGPDAVEPGDASVEAIRVMAARMGAFFDRYGQPEEREFSFEPADGDSMGYVSMTMGGGGTWGGYTVSAACGNGDYISGDTMWLVKADGSEVTEADTLELLMWAVMGVKSGQSKYQAVKRMGILEPGTGTAYTMSMDAVPADVLEAVCGNVLGYPEKEDAQ